MSMVVRTNSMAMSANSALNKNNSTVAGNLQKLSTGFRINRAADDASGLAVSEKMKAQIKALDQAGKNAQDGASLIKTAEGYMGEIHDMLNRIVELAEKSANGTFETKDGEKYGDAATDRQAIQDEVDQLTTEIDRIASTANFNKLNLLDGSLATEYVKTYDYTSVSKNPAQEGGSVKDMYTISGDTVTKCGDDDKATADGTYYTFADAGSTFSATTTYYTVSGGNYTKVEDPQEEDIADYKVAQEQTVTRPSGGDSVTGLYTLKSGTAGEADAVYEKITDENAKAAQGVTYYEQSAQPTGEEKKGTGLTLQIGETSAASDKLEVSIMSFKTADLFKDISTVTADNTSDAAKTAGFAKEVGATEGYQGLTINVSTQATASEAAEKVRDVINKVSAQRATLGAMENRLDYTMNNLDTASQNITDANSRIRDTDMAKTMMQYTQGNTLTQAAQAMLAQANQAPSQVLQLLQ